MYYRSRQMTSEYVNWLIGFVCSGSQRDLYHSLFNSLMDYEFYPIVDHDSNRCTDGLLLRDQFAELNNIPAHFWEGTLANTCSVLEMMVALAISWDRDLMYDPLVGNRTGKWFWEMLNNMGIAEETDLDFNYDYVDECLRALVERNFSYDGVGGLFPLHEPPCDQRTCELWYQLNYYVMENYFGNDVRDCMDVD